MPGMTLTEKILFQHAIGWHKDFVQAGDLLSISVDWTMASELAWNGMNQTYTALGRPPLHNRDRFYLALDHTVDPVTLANDQRTQRLVHLSRTFAQEAELRYFFDANETIMHTEFYRQLVRPGEVVLGADSHTSSHGGMGAFAIGLGGADIAIAMVLGKSWILVPEAIRVHYRNRLPFGLTGKDVILKTLGTLGRNTVAMERTVEYTADHPEDFTTDFRFTIANMTAEFGGLNGIFAPDERTAEAMQRRVQEEFRQGGYWFRADEDARYVDRFDIELADLSPQIAKPFSPDNVVPVEEVIGQKLDGCFIGACTTTQEELILGALVLEAGFKRGLQPVESGKRLVIPGSKEVRLNLEKAGLLTFYELAGFRIGEPGCSMCLGIASDRAEPDEVWLTSQNRNFHNRMGKGSLAWLASGPTVAASAFQMQISDPRPLLAEIDQDKWRRIVGADEPMPEVVITEPQKSAEEPAAAEESSTAEASGVRISGRVQCFGDNVDTDAMIPGEFCHLSDLKEIGEKAFYHVRPDFVQRVRRGEDIIVAGEGWGSGSSREHAAWALKGAGVKAIIAKSFAYIHKRNLVNEAIPFIILRDEAFYQAVSDGDSIEVDLAAGEVHHGGKSYRGEALPVIMRRIMASGGIVPHVKKKLAEGR